MNAVETEREPSAGPREAQEAPQAPRSALLDEVRGIRAKAVNAPPRQIDLTVPGYQDRLAVIYRYPESGGQRVLDSIEKMVESDEFAVKVDAACDRLLVCAVAIVGRPEDGKGMVDLITGETIARNSLPEAPIKFDARFAELIGLEVPAEVKARGRHIVRHTFSPMALSTGRYEGDLALISTSNVLFSWLNGAEAEVEDAALGE